MLFDDKEEARDNELDKPQESLIHGANVHKSRPTPKKPFRKPFRKRLTPASVVAILIVAGLVAGAAFFAAQYNQAQNEVRRLSNPQEAAKEEVKQVVSKVGELMILPQNETPTLATVSDLSKLKSQEFFAGAAVGDKVLIYSKARKAILYRPSIDKIVNVGPLNIGDDKAETQDSTKSTTKPDSQAPATQQQTNKNPAPKIQTTP